jgi:hypothetical protein
MEIREAARLGAPLEVAAKAAKPIAHICVIAAVGRDAALGKEYVASNDGTPFATEAAAQDAITYGLRQADGTRRSPWRQLRGNECEYHHPRQHVAAAVPVFDLDGLENLLTTLQTAPHRDLAIARGGLKLKSDTEPAVLPLFDGVAGGLEALPAQRISAEQHENFEDAPSRLLLLDLDGLHTQSLDVADASQGDVDDAVRAVVDGIPTLSGASFVFQPTSSFGLIDRQKLSGRLAFIVDRPITLEEEQVLTDLLNREAGRALFDTSICATGHLLYTSLPAVYADIAGRERRRLSFTSAHIDGLLARVIEGERASISVPSLDKGELEAVRTVRAAARQRNANWLGDIAHVPVRPLVWSRDIAPLLAQISSTGAYEQVRDSVMRIALRAPAGKFQALLKRLAAEAKMRILETSAGGDLKRRLEHAEIGQLESGLDIALSKIGRRKKRVALTRTQAPISLKDGRADVMKALDGAVNAHGTVLDEWRRACGKAIRGGAELPKRPTLPVVVIKAPPGLGKTHATNEIQDRIRASSSHLLHLTPTIDLAKQKLRDYQTRWGAAGSRRLQSRQELCIDPSDWGRKCEELERRGQSPQPICSKCPHEAICPAPTRQRNFTTGLTVGTHPQAEVLFGDQWLGRSVAHVKKAEQPEHVFWDETVVPALLGEKRSCDMDSALFDTGARQEIAAAIKASKAEVEVSSVSARGVVGWAWAAQSEADRREAAAADIVSIVAARSGAKPKRRAQAGRAKRDADAARLAQAQGAYEQAAFFELASRAIMQALLNGRRYVFGLDAHGATGSAQLPKQLPAMIRQAGVYVLDATSVPVLDRALLGADTIVHSVPPVKPGAVHLTQFCDRSYGQGFFVDADRSDSNIARLHAFIRYEAAVLLSEQRPHSCVVDGRKIDVAVMCQPRIRQMLEERGLPGNVHITTHRLARGLNFAEQAPCVISVGRTMPRKEELLRQARVVAAGLPPNEGDDLLTLDASGNDSLVLPCADGTGVEVRKLRHLHPLVQALTEYYESDVMQSAFRGRPLSRPASNPLRLIVFGNVATGLPIDEPLDWLDAARSELDVQQALGVVRERAPAQNKSGSGEIAPNKRSGARARACVRMWSYFAGEVFFGPAPAGTSSRARELAAQETWAEHCAETAADPRWRAGHCLVAGHRYRQRVSIDTSRHADPQEAVQRVFGPQAIWRGWEGEPAPKRPRGRPRKAGAAQ